MTPQDRQRLAQNEQRLRSLSPAQQQELRDRARVWQQMTPEQREHIRNDVLPRWKQLSPQRQRAIQQRLGVLQNMPESARNRHLSDPNFTRGMSEEDRQLLRDLSHQHVGGAPEQSREQ
jgi:phytoene dehydrogenase-like protein